MKAEQALKILLSEDPFMRNNKNITLGIDYYVTVVEAIKKQIPQQPIKFVVTYNKETEIGKSDICPSCKKSLPKKIWHCPACGQALEWSNNNES